MQSVLPDLSGREGTCMMIVVRILGVSLLTAGLGASLGLILFGQLPRNEYLIPCILFGCVGGVVGAIAGVGLEIVTVLRHRTWSELK
jgi:hypothetical protein